MNVLYSGIMEVVKSLRRIIPILLVVGLLVWFQYLSFIKNSLAIPFPHTQQKQTALCNAPEQPDMDSLMHESGCMCAMVNVEPTGFPLRNDINDLCQQDGTKSLPIQVVNWLIQIVIVTLIYVALRKLQANV